MLTDKQYWYLSTISYLDIPKAYKNKFISGKTTLRQMARIWIEDILRNWVYSNVTHVYHPEYFSPSAGEVNFLSRDEFILILLYIIDNPFFDELIFYKFIYNKGKGKSGICFYDFLWKENTRVLAFRGSEANSGNVLKEKDWQDNFYMALFDSNHYPDINKYLKEKIQYDCTIYVTGHSKGGNNALYACSIDKRICGRVFDAPGFGLTITDEQILALKQRDIINYVCCDDWVGAVLTHPEKRIFCNGRYPISGVLDMISGHMLQQFSFDNNDNIISSDRSEHSIAVEKIYDNVMNTVINDLPMSDMLNNLFDIIWPLYLENNKRLNIIKNITPAVFKKFISQIIQSIVKKIMSHKNESSLQELVISLFKAWGKYAEQYESSGYTDKKLPDIGIPLSIRQQHELLRRNKKKHKNIIYY